jgi:hypothetical protein
MKIAEIDKSPEKPTIVKSEEKPDASPGHLKQEDYEMTSSKTDKNKKKANKKNKNKNRRTI